MSTTPDVALTVCTKECITFKLFIYFPKKCLFIKYGVGDQVKFVRQIAVKPVNAVFLKHWYEVKDYQENNF